MGKKGSSAFAKGVQKRLESFFCGLLTEEAGSIEKSSLQIPTSGLEIMAGLKTPSARFGLTPGSRHR
jgi:hypothetical protein